MSALMKRTGASRSSIHYYLREGLLPQPQKTAINRALYTQHHVDLLDRIVDLREKGHSLDEIRVALKDDVVRAQADNVDLAQQESDRVRHLILRVATEEFMTYGYRRTRVTTIIRKAGITSQTFYSHFASKGELLVESFRTFIHWNLAFVEPKLNQTADLGERLLMRVHADFRANALGSEVLSLVRSDATEGAQLTRLVEQAWAEVVKHIVAEFEGMRQSEASWAISPELLAYGMIGALHNASLRASWDDKYSKEDLVAAHLWLFLAVMAALSGEVNVDARLTGYAELIKEVANRPPATPPALQE
jgi:AcrR family transcriptional regulator